MKPTQEDYEQAAQLLRGEGHTGPLIDLVRAWEGLDDLARMDIKEAVDNAVAAMHERRAQQED